MMKNNKQQLNNKKKCHSELNSESKNISKTTSSNVAISNNTSKTSQPLKEGIEGWSDNNKAFKKWSEKKEYIHKNRNPVYARRKEMWWCAVGCNIGFEQDGKNNYFERPVLILKRFNKHLILTVSLSSVVKKDNPYYYKYILKNREYSVILSQVRVMSSKRLLRKYGMMPAKDFINIQKAISEFCK